MKNIKCSKIVLIITILLVMGFIINLVTSFYGNPISAAIATSKIRTYVDETYPNMELEVPKVKYNFKFEEYTSHIQSKTSSDTRFMVSWSNGKIYNSYDGDVVQRYSTYGRLQQEFSDKMKEIIKKEFLYETSMVFADMGKEDGDISSLTLDMALDITNPPIPTELSIYILTDDISYEFLSARLLEIYDIMGKYKVPIEVFSVVLEEPMEEGEKADPDGERIYLYDFPASEVLSDNLMERIKEHQTRWEAEGEKK